MYVVPISVVRKIIPGHQLVGEILSKPCTYNVYMYVPVIIAILLSYFLSEATGWISLKLDIGNSVTDIASPP